MIDIIFLQPLEYLNPDFVYKNNIDMWKVEKEGWISNCAVRGILSHNWLVFFIRCLFSSQSPYLSPVKADTKSLEYEELGSLASPLILHTELKHL